MQLNTITRRDLGFFVAAVAIANAIVLLGNFANNWQHVFGVMFFAVGWAAFITACTYHAIAKGLHPAIGFLLSLFSMVGLLVLIILPAKKRLQYTPAKNAPIGWIDISYLVIGESVGLRLATMNGALACIGFLIGLYGYVYLALIFFAKINTQHKRVAFLVSLFIFAFVQSAIVAGLMK